MGPPGPHIDTCFSFRLQKKKNVILVGKSRVCRGYLNTIAANTLPFQSVPDNKASTVFQRKTFSSPSRMNLISCFTHGARGRLVPCLVSSTSVPPRRCPTPLGRLPIHSWHWTKALSPCYYPGTHLSHPLNFLPTSCLCKILKGVTLLTQVPLRMKTVI